MRSRTDSTSPRPSSPPNAFAPGFLEQLQEVEEPPTASEAELAGPWKREAVPGHPGAVAVLRVWESLGEGDVPELVFVHEEGAALGAVVLPLIEREPLVHLGSEPVPDGPLPSGYPVIAMFGDEPSIRRSPCALRCSLPGPAAARPAVLPPRRLPAVPGGGPAAGEAGQPASGGGGVGDDEESRPGSGRALPLWSPHLGLPGWKVEERGIVREAQARDPVVELADLEPAQVGCVPEATGRDAAEFVAAIGREGYPAFREREENG